MTDHEHRATDAPYGQDEADTIRARMSRHEPLTCPRCGGPLATGERVVEGKTHVEVYSVRCPACRRSLFAAEEE